MITEKTSAPGLPNPPKAPNDAHGFTGGLAAPPAPPGGAPNPAIICCISAGLNNGLAPNPPAPAPAPVPGVVDEGDVVEAGVEVCPGTPGAGNEAGGAPNIPGPPIGSNPAERIVCESCIMLRSASGLELWA